VPVGTTGESATLSEAEHKRVITLCVEAANGRVPVIAGAGSNDTRVAVELAQHAKDLGADAALVVTPYYNKPNQLGLYEHFKAVANSVDIPVIVYNIPGRSVIDINNDTMQLLASLENVVGCKDATGDITRVTALIDHLATAPTAGMALFPLGPILRPPHMLKCRTSVRRVSRK